MSSPAQSTPANLTNRARALIERGLWSKETAGSATSFELTGQVKLVAYAGVEIISQGLSFTIIKAGELMMASEIAQNLLAKGVSIEEVVGTLKRKSHDKQNDV